MAQQSSVHPIFQDILRTVAPKGSEFSGEAQPKTVCWVELRDQYGNTVVRPIGPVAEAFAEIAGTKTLTAHTLRQIKKLGYSIQIESGGSGRGYDFLNKFIG